jgi:hypothetical protein
MMSLTTMCRPATLAFAMLSLSACGSVSADDFKSVSPASVIAGYESSKFSAFEAEQAASYSLSVLRLRVRHADEPRAIGIVTVNQPISSSHTAQTGRLEITTINRTMGGDSSRSKVTEEGHRAEITAAGGTVISSRETSPERSRETTFERAGQTCILVGAAPYDSFSKRDSGGYRWVASGLFCGPDTYRTEFSRYVREGTFSYVYPRR